MKLDEIFEALTLIQTRKIDQFPATAAIFFPDGKPAARGSTIVQSDLAAWTPPRDAYDLVACLYVHVAGSVEEMVERMAAGVASAAAMSRASCACSGG